MALTKGKIIGIIFIILILIAVAFIWSVVSNKEISGISLESKDTYFDDQGGSGLEVKAVVLVEGSSEVSGKGNVKIYYGDKDNEIYSRSISVINDISGNRSYDVCIDPRVPCIITRVTEHGKIPGLGHSRWAV